MTKSVKLTWTIITLNLFIATMIITIMFDFKSVIDLFTSLPLNHSIGLIGLYASGYYIANKMNYQINLKKRNSLIIGFIGLLLILIIGTFAGSSVGFFQEGYSSGDNFSQFKDAVFDYYCKPFFWIFFFGIIPTLLTGMILGKLIKNYR